MVSVPSRALGLAAALLAACATGGSDDDGDEVTVLPPVGFAGTGGTASSIPGGSIAGHGGAASTLGASGASGSSVPDPASMPAPSVPVVGGPGAGAPAPTTPPAAGTAGAAAPAPAVTPDQSLTTVTDYAAPGQFGPTMEVLNTGPDGQYSMYRAKNLDVGFKFVPATWGNGITTTPQFYPWLQTVASHGFVIIASNSTAVSAAQMTAGLDWLIAQNDAPGELQGKLDVSRAVCMGYSLGGQGAVTCGAHPKVIATIAMHPAGGFASGLHGPLLLFSGALDTVCVPSSFVQPIFDSSPVPTFYGFLSDADHLEPVLPGITSAGRETAPFIAWLRLWVFGDEGAKAFFYGPSCKLCAAPWEMAQSKMLE